MDNATWDAMKKDRAEKNLAEAIRNLKEAFGSVLLAYEDCNRTENGIVVNDYVDAFSTAYPFHLSFDELAADVQDWARIFPSASRFKVGQRRRLVSEIDRFPDFLAKAGLTGVVTHIEPAGASAPCISLLMDERLPGAEEWENIINWDSEVEFFTETEPVTEEEDRRIQEELVQ